MGLYLRKAFNFGPFRLNLSKGGLGLSVGVKGARINVNPKGVVGVHAGRGGLYFRDTIGRLGTSSDDCRASARRSLSSADSTGRLAMGGPA